MNNSKDKTIKIFINSKFLYALPLVSVGMICTQQSVHAMLQKNQPTTTKPTSTSRNTLTTTTSTVSTSTTPTSSRLSTSSLGSQSSLGARPKTSSLSTPSTSNLKSSISQSNLSSPLLTTKNLVGENIKVESKSTFGNSMKILVRNALTDMMVLKIKTPQGEDLSEILSNTIYILKKDVSNKSKEAFTTEAQKQLSSKNIAVNENSIKTIDESAKTFSEVMLHSIGKSFNEARQKLKIIDTGNKYRDLNLMMDISKDIQSSVESSSSSNFESSIRSFVKSFR